MKQFFLSIIIWFFVGESYSQSKVCSIKKSPSSASISSRYTLYKTSGNYILDQQTNFELSFLGNAFLVYPNFFFYDDNDGKNSKATDEITISNLPDGTIIFGKRLFSSQLLRPNGITVIPVMMAHEFAHIVDFKYGALNHVSNKKKELFADYLAGVFMSVRRHNLAVVFDINVAVESFEELGDTDFGDVDKHGDAEERGAALLAGFESAESYYSQGTVYKLTLLQTIKEAKEYLKTIKDGDDDAIDPDKE